MKKFTKLLGIVLIIALVMSMGITAAFAAAGDYQITVENTNEAMSINGKTYSAYKVFDLTLGQETTTGEGADAVTTYGAYAYSIKSTDWAFATLTAGATTDSTTGVITTTYGIVLTPSAADPTNYSVDGESMTDAQARSFADALKTVLPATADGTGIGANEKAVIDLSVGGWYAVYGVVIPTDPKAAPAEEIVAAIGLTSTDKKVTVNPKASVPTLDKKITGVTEDGNVLDDAGKAAVAKVGAKVSYELDSVTPDLTGYTDYTFKISDTISSGLTYDNTSLSSLVLKIDGTAVAAANYTLAVDGQTFTLTIPYNTLKNYTAGKAIVVTYDAIVNSNALTTDYEKNTANLEYSHSPYDKVTNKTPDKETYVIDLNLDVLKVDGQDQTKKLDGAEFKLYKTEAGATTYSVATEYSSEATYYSDNDGTDTVVAVDSAEAFASAGTLYTKSVAEDSKLYYKWADSKVTWVSGQDNGDTFTTNSAGNLTQQVQGLDDGTYYFEETKAPSGYNLLKAPVTVVITATPDSTSAVTKVTYTATYAGENAAVTNGQVDLTAAQNANQPVVTGTIANNSGTELPSTGGIGTTIFYVVGSILVVAAGVLLITKKRMSREG
jgi:fimbrial isopeptide formation D2 family protein/LPXTG-motif cell wall-anchored protein